MGMIPALNMIPALKLTLPCPNCKRECLFHRTGGVFEPISPEKQDLIYRTSQMQCIECSHIVMVEDGKVIPEDPNPFSRQLHCPRCEAVSTFWPTDPVSFVGAELTPTADKWTCTQCGYVLDLSAEEP